MHPLAATFEVGRAQLAANPAVAALADPETSTKLAVVPTMAFWVLGFGDAMALIRSTGGDIPLGGDLRQHAMEDAEHWRWFVANLEALASRGVGARSVGDALLWQCGPETGRPDQPPFETTSRAERPRAHSALAVLEDGLALAVLLRNGVGHGEAVELVERPAVAARPGLE